MAAHLSLATFRRPNKTILTTLPELQIPKALTFVEPCAASAVLLSNFGAPSTPQAQAQDTPMYSIVARLDGVLVVHAIFPSGVLLSGSRRVIPLGEGPVHLALVPAQGSAGFRVVTAGKRTVTLSIANKQLSISALPITVYRASLALVGET